MKKTHLPIALLALLLSACANEVPPSEVSSSSDTPSEVLSEESVSSDVSEDVEVSSSEEEIQEETSSSESDEPAPVLPTNPFSQTINHDDGFPAPETGSSYPAPGSFTFEGTVVSYVDVSLGSGTYDGTVRMRAESSSISFEREGTYFSTLVISQMDPSNEYNPYLAIPHVYDLDKTVEATMTEVKSEGTITRTYSFETPQDGLLIENSDTENGRAGYFYSFALTGVC